MDVLVEYARLKPLAERLIGELKVEVIREVRGVLEGFRVKWSDILFEYDFSDGDLDFRLVIPIEYADFGLLMGFVENMKKRGIEATGFWRRELHFKISREYIERKLEEIKKRI